MISPAVTATFLGQMMGGCHRHFAEQLTAINADLGAFFAQAADLEGREPTDEPA
jgi:hypothetical protein